MQFFKLKSVVSIERSEKISLTKGKSLTMKMTKTAAMLLTAAGLLGGVAGTVAFQTKAQTTTAAAATSTAQTATAANGTAQTRPHGHAPLGGDGNITAINGNTITMQEEADEGGALYTVDASNATVTNNGATSTLSALKIGDKIFVQGTTSGNNVVASSVSLGHPGGQKFRGNPDSADTAPSSSPTAPQ